MKLSILLRVFTRPRLVRVERPHPRVALGAGQTSLHIVAEGAGVITVGGVHRYFAGRFDEVLLVPTGELEVRARGLLGTVRSRVPDAVVLSPAPAHFKVTSSRAGASTAPNELLVVVPPVRVGPTRPMAHAIARFSPTPRPAATPVLPAFSLRTDLVRPRFQLPAGEPALPGGTHDDTPG